MHIQSPQHFLQEIVEKALMCSASDIYIDTTIKSHHKCIVVTYRIHGVCESPNVYENISHDEFFRYIKIIMGIRIDAHHVPYDGSCSFTSLGLNSLGDIRCAIIPSVQGYACTLRISSMNTKYHSLIELGCDNSHINDIQTMMSISAGLVIVVGPTGSGKTTLLHCMIEQRAEKDMVIAIEDPVEVELKNVRHIEINEIVGRTYARCLKSVLRQSPDCILIGELRDAETVSIAIQAALTGHAVYASLHTYGISTVISRLTDLGASLASINEVLRGIVAMRLIRTICTECSGALRDIQKGECVCRNGYSGRTGIFETSCDITKSFISMKEHGLYKVGEGRTHHKEIERVLS